jgi:hypothetical protein
VPPTPQPTFRSKWHLPRVGAPVQEPLLVSGLREDIVKRKICQALAAAQQAAAAVPETAAGDERAAAVAKRAAAEAALKRVLREMGVAPQGLTLPPAEMVGQLEAAGLNPRQVSPGDWGWGR